MGQNFARNILVPLSGGGGLAGSIYMSHCDPRYGVYFSLFLQITKLFSVVKVKNLLLGQIWPP